MTLLRSSRVEFLSRVSLPLALLLLATNVFSETPDTKELESLGPIMDEITVVETKRVVQLRKELANADDRLFEIYNTLNTDDSLDMVCKKETRIGSQILNRVCKSAYHREVESESGSDYLSGDGGSSPYNVSSSHYKKVRANMANLMAEHAELQQAFIERALLRKKIAEAKAEADE